MAVRFGTRTDIGRLRQNNEDALYANKDKDLFLVADGMGGHQAGEIASRLALEQIRSFVETGNPGPLTIKMLESAVEASNKAIYLKSIEDPSLYGMGTTLVMALIRDRTLLVAHVGDSRAYLLKERKLQRLTQDHSTIAKLMAEGRITEEEARRHPRRGGILRALGTERFVEVDIQELPYNGELLLLCTDGLTDMLSDEEIEEVLKATPEPQQACELLVEKAKEAGGMDNITVVVVRG